MKGDIFFTRTDNSVARGGVYWKSTGSQGIRMETEPLYAGSFVQKPKPQTSGRAVGLVHCGFCMPFLDDTSVMTLPVPMPRIQSIGACALLMGAVFCLVPNHASGQLWVQTSKVVAPVHDGPLRAFLDTLVNVAERKQLTLTRSPDAGETLTVSTLRDLLIDEEGIGVSSANYVFIDYRFSIGSSGGLQQEIAGLYFVFRPGPNQNDIPVLYLEPRDGWFRDFLRTKGTRLRTNEAAFIPFRQHLSFATIARDEESQVVEIGGETVRDGFDERKETLILKVERLMYEDYV